jgi:hypothetical protein
MRRLESIEKIITAPQSIASRTQISLSKSMTSSNTQASYAPKASWLLIPCFSQLLPPLPCFNSETISVIIP